MNTKVIRIGILGCSNIASRKFIPAIKSCRYAVLDGVASRSQEKAKSWAKDSNVKAYTYEELLKSSDIDMIYISLPNSLHKEWSIKALENDKHVLCEKPLSIDSVSTEEMVEIAKRNKKYLFEGFMHLYHPQHSEVKRRLKDKIIGEPVIFRSSFGFNLNDPGNFRLRKELGGGAFLDTVGYPISTIRFLFDCEPVKSTGFQKRNNAGLDIAGVASIVMENGIAGQISYGFNYSYECFYQIIGTKGNIFLDRCYTIPETMKSTIRIRIENNEETLTVDEANHFTLMIDNFSKKIIDGKSREEIYLEILKQAKAMELVKKGLLESK